jgi:hypothetical protein
VRLQPGTAGTFYNSRFINNRATTNSPKKKGLGPAVGLQDTKDLSSIAKPSYAWFQGCHFQGNDAGTAPEAVVSRTTATCSVLSDSVQPLVVDQKTGAVEVPLRVHEVSAPGAVDPLFTAAVFLTEGDVWFQKVAEVCASGSRMAVRFVEDVLMQSTSAAS